MIFGKKKTPPVPEIKSIKTHDYEFYIGHQNGVLDLRRGHVLMMGGMGSGKSVGGKTPVYKFLEDHPEAMVFILDPFKGANDFSFAFKYENCITSLGDTPEGIPSIIELVANELRTRISSAKSQNNSPILVLFEEMHGILNIPHNEKFVENLDLIFKEGFKHKVYFLGICQRLRLEDFKKEWLQYFSHKMLYRMHNTNDLRFVDPLSKAHTLQGHEKGICYLGDRKIQMPYLNEKLEELYIGGKNL